MFPKQIKELKRVNKKYEMIKFIEKEHKNNMVGHIFYIKGLTLLDCDYCNNIGGWSSDCKRCGGYDDLQRWNSIVRPNYFIVTSVDIHNNNRVGRMFGFCGYTPEDCLRKEKISVINAGVFPMYTNFLYSGGMTFSTNKYKWKATIL